MELCSLLRVITKIRKRSKLINTTPVSCGGELSVPTFEKGEGIRKKKATGGGLKSDCHIYLPGGYYVPCQKKSM